MKKSKIAQWQAIAAMMGSIMGAGILGLPYALSQGGIMNGFLLMIVIGIMIMFLHLFVGEIVLSSKNAHQLTGYANKYLGPVGKWVMFQTFMVASYGSLLAYIIGGGEVLQALFGGNNKLWTLLFFCIGSVLLYIGLKVIKKIGFLLMFGLLAIIIILAIACLGHWESTNLVSFDMMKLFAPYGVVLFSFLGASSIYQARKILEGREKLLKQTIIISSLLPLFIYMLFVIIVVGVTGLSTTEIATVGLGNVIGPEINILGNLFAFLTLSTSFLVLGNAVKETYFYDFDLIKDKELDRFVSWILTISIPLFLFIMGNTDFIKILSFVGAIAGGLEGILLVLIYRKLKLRGASRKPEYTIKNYQALAFILLFMFIGGIVYTLII
jgi:tyrosine-specific transport protein